jgi:hypothetical protein
MRMRARCCRFRIIFSFFVIHLPPIKTAGSGASFTHIAIITHENGKGK